MIAGQSPGELAPDDDGLQLLLLLLLLPRQHLSLTTTTTTTTTTTINNTNNNNNHIIRPWTMTGEAKGPLMGLSKPIVRGPAQNQQYNDTYFDNKSDFWRGRVMTGLYTPAKGSMTKDDTTIRCVRTDTGSMHAYRCVLMYVHLSLSLCIYIYIYVPTCLYIYIYIDNHTHTYVCMYIYIYIYTCIVNCYHIIYAAFQQTLTMTSLATYARDRTNNCKARASLVRTALSSPSQVSRRKRTCRNPCRATVRENYYYYYN